VNPREYPDGRPTDPDPNTWWQSCPVDGCATAWDVTPPTVDSTALASVFGLGVMSASATYLHASAVEDALDRHLRTHAVVEWARTVFRLQRELADARGEL